MSSDWARATLAETFADLSVVTIVLMCERATVEQRTRDRGDRLLDYALTHYDLEDWTRVPADLRLVTDARPPTGLAHDVSDWLEAQTDRSTETS